jgi:cobyrinic acid a,c-diamide synthase
VIGGTHSGVGKTSVVIGLMGAFTRKGRRVQGFKVGPDFLDTSFHTAVTKRPSRNLDSWIMPREKIPSIFRQGCEDADLAIIEGVMGVFDGMDGKSELASTSETAKLINAPVILVLDAYGLAASAAAVVVGYKSLDPELNVAGVILNRVAGKTHAEMCGDAIKRHTTVPVLGAIPVDQKIVLPERHLGLIHHSETIGQETVERIIDLVEDSVDIGRVENIARSTTELPEPNDAAMASRRHERMVSIAVARDYAFSFYYQENLDNLAKAGAELRFFSPIVDERVPEDTDGIYIGGGYPELHAAKLAKNEQMLRSLAKLGSNGIPIYAECGGFMYLTRSIQDLNGVEHRTVGLLDARTRMVERLTLSYTLARTKTSNLLTHAGESVKGHEFHYSTTSEIPSDAKFAYDLERGRGISDGRDGWTCYNTLASYMHTSFAWDDRMAERFVDACVRYSKT